jgi:hypothetical protein
VTSANIEKVLCNCLRAQTGLCWIESTKNNSSNTARPCQVNIHSRMRAVNAKANEKLQCEPNGTTLLSAVDGIEDPASLSGSDEEFKHRLGNNECMVGSKTRWLVCLCDGTYVTCAAKRYSNHLQ